MGIAWGLLALLGGSAALGRDTAPVRAEAGGRFLMTGSLRAVSSRALVTPRTPNWMVAIRWLAPEGGAVRAGEPVVQFDTSAVLTELKDKRLAVSEAAATLERTTLDLEASRRDKRIEVLRLRVARDKAKLDAGVPASLQAKRDHQEKQLALERAELDLRKAQAGLTAFEKESAARLAELRERLEKVKRDVQRGEASLEDLVLKAPVDGVLLHGSHPWEGRKWQVGDSCWPGTVVAEVPDLSAMEVEAQLSDVDDGKIAPGLLLHCRLDTYPAQVFPGRIRSISGVAQPLDRNSSRRFFTVLVDIERSDPALMRPGMSVKLEVLRGPETQAPGAAAARPMPARGARRHRIARGDLAVTMEATGSLSAVETSAVSPPSIAGQWDYKIEWMAPESSDVKKGQPVLRFDPSELEQELERKQAEQAEAAKATEKKEIDLQVQLLELDLRLAEAAGALRRAKLKNEATDAQASRIAADKGKLDLELAAEELHALEERRGFVQRSGQSEVTTLREKSERAQGRVQELEEAIERMNVAAPRDGIVVYRADWRGNKRKVGDSVSTWERLLELPDLSRMQAAAEIDEADAGRAELGQSARVRLESHPDLEWRASVTEIAPIVQRQSQRSALKVYKIKLALETTDTEKMRPGMRFRADIETERRAGVLLLPLEAVLIVDGRAFVHKAAGGSFVRTPVELGSRNASMVELKSGLAEGEEVALP